MIHQKRTLLWVVSIYRPLWKDPLPPHLQIISLIGRCDAVASLDSHNIIACNYHQLHQHQFAFFHMSSQAPCMLILFLYAGMPSMPIKLLAVVWAWIQLWKSFSQTIRQDPSPQHLNEEALSRVVLPCECRLLVSKPSLIFKLGRAI